MAVGKLDEVTDDDLRSSSTADWSPLDLSPQASHHHREPCINQLQDGRPLFMAQGDIVQGYAWGVKVKGWRDGGVVRWCKVTSNTPSVAQDTEMQSSGAGR